MSNYGINIAQDGIKDMDEFYKNNSAEDYARNQIGIENKLLRSASDDAALRTRGLMAARGMQNSSIGLGLEQNANRSLMDKLAMNNAGLNGRILDYSRQQQADGMNPLQNKVALSGPMQMRNISMRGKNGFGQLMDTAQSAANIYSSMNGGGGMQVNSQQPQPGQPQQNMTSENSGGSKGGGGGMSGMMKMFA
jgi:hypothetical protein